MHILRHYLTTANKCSPVLRDLQRKYKKPSDHQMYATSG